MARQLRGDSIALTKGLLIAVSAILPQRPCPLSLAPLASSPKGGAIGRPGHFPLTAGSSIWRKK